MAQQSSVKPRALAIFLYTLMFLLVYQTGHMVDHVLQYIQTYLMGIGNPPALFEGILNASDTTIHLWLNVIDLVAFAVLWISFRESQVNQSIASRLDSKRPRPLTILMAAMFFLLIFQTLHVIDHILQYVQYYTMGIEGPPGLFQGLFSETDRIIHTWVNGIIILAIFLVWASFRGCQLKKIISPVLYTQRGPRTKTS